MYEKSKKGTKGKLRKIRHIYMYVGNIHKNSLYSYIERKANPNV